VDRRGKQLELKSESPPQGGLFYFFGERRGAAFEAPETKDRFNACNTLKA
jgi:hypothetical protein